MSSTDRSLQLSKEGAVLRGGRTGREGGCGRVIGKVLGLAWPSSTSRVMHHVSRVTSRAFLAPHVLVFSSREFVNVKSVSPHNCCKHFPRLRATVSQLLQPSIPAISHVSLHSLYVRSSWQLPSFSARSNHYTHQDLSLDMYMR
jgi:hypothetical protein